MVKGRSLSLNWSQSAEPSMISEFRKAVPIAVPQPLPKDSSGIPLPPGMSSISDLPAHLR
jgi:hypothetical protein